jgi:hypothetical protein
MDLDLTDTLIVVASTIIDIHGGSAVSRMPAVKTF